MAALWPNPPYHKRESAPENGRVISAIYLNGRGVVSQFFHLSPGRLSARMLEVGVHRCRCGRRPHPSWGWVGERGYGGVSPQKIAAIFSAFFVHFNVSFSSFQHSSRLTHKKVSIFGAFFVHFKRPLPAANKCWSTRVGEQLVCETQNNKLQKNLARIETSSICRQQIANVLLCRSHTNLSFSTQVG